MLFCVCMYIRMCMRVCECVGACLCDLLCLCGYILCVCLMCFRAFLDVFVVFVCVLARACHPFCIDLCRFELVCVCS